MKGSRKRRFLKSVSNAKIFVWGQSVVCFAVMACSAKALYFGMTFLYARCVLFCPGEQESFDFTYVLQHTIFTRDAVNFPLSFWGGNWIFISLWYIIYFSGRFDRIHSKLHASVLLCFGYP